MHAPTMPCLCALYGKRGPQVGEGDRAWYAEAAAGLFNAIQPESTFKVRRGGGLAGCTCEESASSANNCIAMCPQAGAAYIWQRCCQPLHLLATDKLFP